MPKMYAEGKFPKGAPTREAMAHLMATLDREAADAAHRVTDDVTVMEYEPGLELNMRHIRIEAEVTPL